MPKKVTIYTDGACAGNPGPGGYGVVILNGTQRTELSAGYKRTTNNRMEIKAAIAGLQALPPGCDLQIFTDSQYLAQAYNQGWVRRWQSNGWRKKDRGKVQNVDLWRQLADLCSQHSVVFHWVKGHQGDPENERCNTLAVRASRGSNLAVDEAFVSGKTEYSPPTLFDDL